MRVKKYKGSVFGAVLNAAEKKAMNMEIQRQLVEYERKHTIELEAIVLWVLHEQLGFGEKRLRRFHDSFTPEVEALLKRSEMDDSDEAWLCTRKLKDIGVDIEKWG